MYIFIGTLDEKKDWNEYSSTLFSSKEDEYVLIERLKKFFTEHPKGKVIITEYDYSLEYYEKEGNHVSL
ncbi:MAG: hypothetical protein WC998_00615 [Candidatus Paceibacterota bacterium]|jgi:hypothetical protein